MKDDPLMEEENLLAPTDRPPTQAERREAFCRHFALHGSPSTAYLQAYDCKPESAAANAGRLLKREDVQTRIAELEADRRRTLREKANDIETALAALVTADTVDLVDEDDVLSALRALPADVRQWISVSVEITVGADGQPAKKIKASIPNKLDGMKFLAQLQGRLVHRQDVTSGGRSLAAPVDLEEQLDAAVRNLIAAPAEQPVDADFDEIDPADGFPKELA